MTPNEPLCRFCQAPLKETFCDLGESPLSNSYLSEEELTQEEAFFPLHAYVCSQCLLVQLPALHTPSQIFEEYAYFSSYSSSWLEHANTYAKQAQERFHLSPQSQVVEVASNDGYLLQYFQELGIPVFGVEPAKNVAAAARLKGIPTEACFFGKKTAQELQLKADLLIGNNVFAHVPYLHDFVEGFKLSLKPTGVLSLEFPHLLRLMEENQFDTIYHEHFSYFSFHVAQKILAYHDLEVFDVQELPTHGGSLRVFAQHARGPHQVLSSVETLLQKERIAGLFELHTYLNFKHKVKDLLEMLTAFLKNHQEVCAYGAPAKGNTLLNACALSRRELPFTVDRNLYKQGKFLPGTHIPILPVEKIQEVKPRYLLVLPWNLRAEIKSQMAYIRDWGGKFVFPIPKLSIED